MPTEEAKIRSRAADDLRFQLARCLRDCLTVADLAAKMPRMQSCNDNLLNLARVP